MLTRTEFRLRDQGTAAGFLWTLLHPLLLFLILHKVFVAWLAPRIPDYAACLLVGIVQWNFFSAATSAGLTSLRRKAALLSSYSFPRVFIVLSSVAAVLLSHLLEWAVLLVALLLLGVKPGLGWLALPLLIAAESALAVALSCPLAVLCAEVRDLERVWGLLLYGVFFLTPVFYTTAAAGEGARAWVDRNPLSWVIEASRAAALGGGRAMPQGWAVPLGAALFCAAAVLSFPRLSRGVEEKL